MTIDKLVIRPVGADCNLNCAYCYLRAGAGLSPEAAAHRMPLDVLERAVRGFLALPLPRHTFVFQGGEPLLAGIDFFRVFGGLVERYAPPEAHPACIIETNGTLITDEWAQFFARRGFIVRVSLDGPPELHNACRKTALGEATHAQVLAGIERLKKHGVKFTASVVVSPANVDHPEAVYRYLRDEVGCDNHEYNPCMDAEGFAVTAEQWGGFLCRLYDIWYPADTLKVSVRFFDTLLAQMVQGLEVTCVCRSDCRSAVVIEPSGDVYPCDFYTAPEWKLGNIAQDDLRALLMSPLYEAFGLRKRKWPAKCNTCNALRYCRGDCVKHRDAGGDSRLCAGLQAFYAHALPTLLRLGWQLYQKAHGLKPGRNDPCPCGSGKKLKKCCGSSGRA